MRQNLLFVLTLWAGLGLAFAFSGERFLDLVFEMPDLGSVDDLVLDAVFWFEEMKETAGLPDLFSKLRAFLHKVTGLG